MCINRDGVQACGFDLLKNVWPERGHRETECMEFAGAENRIDVSGLKGIVEGGAGKKEIIRTGEKCAARVRGDYSYPTAPRLFLSCCSVPVS